jgi:hypothetical protein
MKDYEALAPQHFIKPNLKSNIYTKEEWEGDGETYLFTKNYVQPLRERANPVREDI